MWVKGGQKASLAKNGVNLYILSKDGQNQKADAYLTIFVGIKKAFDQNILFATIQFSAEDKGTQEQALALINNGRKLWEKE